MLMTPLQKWVALGHCTASHALPAHHQHLCHQHTHRRRSHSHLYTHASWLALRFVMDPPTNQPAGAASSFKTPQMDQSEWSAATPTATTTTPSRHTFPRRLSLLQNETASPARSDTPQEASRRTSFTGPKPLNLVSQPLSSAVPSSASSSAGPDTPRRGKRTSLSYIPSPSTSKIDDGQLSRAQSTSSASGRTRTGSISRATNASRRRPSQASQASAGANSDADDWLMSEEDASFSLPSAARAMTQRDSAKVEAQFQDVCPFRSPLVHVDLDLVKLTELAFVCDRRATVKASRPAS